jgi:hypothetical protein
MRDNLDLIHPDHDSFQWWALLNTLMNILVRQKAENFLSIVHSSFRLIQWFPNVFGSRRP